MSGRPAPVHHLLLGGQRSGKSREAERRALRWLDAAPGREAVLVATAVAADAEMQQRIARHRQQRPFALATLEAPRVLSATIAQHSAAHRLLVVDCLTLWLTNWLMPIAERADGRADTAADWSVERDRFLAVLSDAVGPVVMVSNEIGLGVTPIGRETRHFVDQLGLLHQDVAKLCQDVTLMVAGQAWRQPVRDPGER